MKNFGKRLAAGILAAGLVVSRFGLSSLAAETEAEDHSGGEENNIVFDAGVFTNEYTPDEVSVNVQAKKVLTGRTLLADEFEFVLTDEDGKTVGEAANSADGTVTFPSISYSSAGKHTYTIREMKGTLEDVTYDDSRYTAVVTVEDDNGALSAHTDYPNGNTFHNTYAVKVTAKTADSPVEVPISAKKRLENGTLTAGQFSFSMYDENGKKIKTAVNDASGVVNFDSVSYNAEGTWKYTIREDAGNASDITYDSSVKDISVTVVKNSEGKLEATITGTKATFVNVKKAETAAVSAGKDTGTSDRHTGDKSRLPLYIGGLAAAGAAAAAIILIFLKKRKQP